MERKWFPFTFTKADPDTGSFEGYASTFGNVDEQGDVVIPGAFAATIPQFLERGFISDAHQADQPIGYPTDAREDGRGLFIAGKFHGTDRAQTVRIFSRERVLAGKEMGLSIGYRIPDGGATVRGDGVRELHVLELVEVALTIMPANVEALVTGVKHTPSAAIGDPELLRLRAEFYRPELRELLEIKANVENVLRKTAGI
jgi:HK97 family phage prohead protease